MARDGLFAFVCAGAMATAGFMAPLGAQAPAGSQDGAVAATLAVQNALQQGREHLLRGDARAAVQVLESQLTRINGNAVYLATLRDAYRAYIKELRLAGQDAQVPLYLQRLQILDPGAVLDAGSTRPANSPAAPVTQPAAAPAPRTTPIARGVREEETDKVRVARSLLARAEEEFGNKRYLEASLLFEKAHQTDPGSTTASRERWAYCKYCRVVEQINQTPAGSPAWADLEREVRQTLELAPRLDYGKYLLDEIQKRRGAAVAVLVRHFERGSDGWARAETSHFRIFHNQSREMAEQAAQVAEKTRVAMHGKWFGTAGEEWNPRCDLYLHATAQDYSKATGVPANSPGHSSIRSDGPRVIGRRIDLHVDDPNLLTAVLPHETTHVVLAGQFGDQPVPRWADEGMAVLTEPRDKVERHLRNLPRCQQDGQLFHVRQLMQLTDYPEPRAISAFYAQSVSLVDYLTNKHGPQVFAQFLREGMRGGYEAALQKHYGLAGFDDLQQRWNQDAFAGKVGSTGLAQAKP